MTRSFSAALLLSTSAGFCAALALPGQAQAQPVSGLYVGAGAGGNFMQPSKSEFIFQAQPPFGTSVSRLKINHAPGYVGLASIGYGFGNGIRVEAEGNYRRNGDSLFTSQKKYGGMVNALFDFDIGSPYVFPYVGVGGGYMRVEDGQFGSKSNTIAYQGIAGLSFPIPYVVGLSATMEYRFVGLSGAKERGFVPASGGSPAFAETEKDYNNLNHSLLVGLRYAFNVPTPAAAVAPATTAALTPASARSYLIFFDWDRADLTARARSIIAEAAQNITHVQHTKIEVDGNADKSGTPQYNLGLSRRRAEAVSSELVRNGVKRSDIAIQAFGDTKPLVQTAAGVREPQNRRVEIVIR